MKVASERSWSSLLDPALGTLLAVSIRSHGDGQDQGHQTRSFNQLINPKANHQSINNTINPKQLTYQHKTMNLFTATALLICSTSFVSAGSSLRGLDKQDNEDQNSHRNLQGISNDQCSKIHDLCTNDNECCGALQCNNFDNTCLPPGLNSAEPFEPIEFNVGEEENEFRPAREGDIRGPCPAINTLANHGFINRDGKDVKVSDLAQALQDVYRVSATTLTNGPINSAMNFHLITEDGDGNTVLTIDQLFQNRDSTEEQTLNPNREVEPKLKNTTRVSSGRIRI